MANTIKHAVPLINTYEGVYSQERMHALIRIYKCYRLIRPSRLVLFVIALIVIWRYHVAYRQLEEEFKTKLNVVMKHTMELNSNITSLLLNNEKKIQSVKDRPTIYAITPTFTRPVQKAELTRLAQTFTLVPKFHWIIVEDAPKKSSLVSNLLNETTLEYTHLNVQTPSNYKLGKNDPNWKKPRGVEQRNAALHWLRSNLNSSCNGVVFFADDDNTYSVKLFNEIIKVKKVGVWPVGLVGGLMVEKPFCDKETNKVTGFNSVWKPNRPFPVDMAGFAINVQLILSHPDAVFAFDVPRGYQESVILKKMLTPNELEPLADYCTKVYVWHTRTEPPKLDAEQQLIKKGKPSNIGIEV